MVVLTAPGERIMDPEFGVGMRNFLFEQNSAAIYSQIKTRISRQAETYLPYIDILDVEFKFEGDNKILASNSLLIKIKFFIRPLGANETLEVYA
jgi:phage baseplate assembly protein W